MSYLTLSDLGQNQQQSFWDWFFRGGVGPKPKKPVKEAAFRQQQAGATYTPDKHWAGMEFEAEAAEDLDPFKAQGYDSAEAIAAMGDVTRWGLDLADDPAPAAASASALPAPVASPAKEGSRVPALIATSLLVGGLGAMLYSAMMSPPEVGRRFNRKRRRN